MKLPRLTILSFLSSSLAAALGSSRQRRTLSAIATTVAASTKKPAPGLASSTSPSPSLVWRRYFFFPPAFQLSLRSSKLTIQTPSSFQPA